MYTVEQSNDFCPYTITHTWQAIDHCNNVTEVQTVITVTVTEQLQVSLISYPNPFNDVFTVEFQVPANALVSACVYDITGREVVLIHKGDADADRLYEYKVTGVDWDAGSYVLMLVVDDEVYYHKMTLLN